MNPSDLPSSPDESQPPPALSLGQRFLLIWVWWLRSLFDGRFAAQLRQAHLEFDQFEGRPPDALPKPPERPSLPGAPSVPSAAGLPDTEAIREEAQRSAAFALLSLLQREGRLIDFLEQDITAFSDGDIGSAARLVHAGCRKVLREHVPVRPVVEQAEGESVRVEAGYDPAAYKLTGQVSGKAPYTGVLRHKGWKAAGLRLPQLVSGSDGSVLTPAEVEI